MAPPEGVGSLFRDIRVARAIDLVAVAKKTPDPVKVELASKDWAEAACRRNYQPVGGRATGGDGPHRRTSAGQQLLARGPCQLGRLSTLFRLQVVLVAEVQVVKKSLATVRSKFVPVPTWSFC